MPMVLAHPDAPASVALTEIAKQLAAQVSMLNFNRPKERVFQPDPDLAVVS